MIKIGSLLFILILSVNGCNHTSYTPPIYIPHILSINNSAQEDIKHSRWNVINIPDTCDNLQSYFTKEKTVYRIERHYNVDTLRIPKDCELFFDGGSLKGVLYFDNTLLSGYPSLKESELNGTIKNNKFEAGWICYGDGVHDDANSINQILKVCNKIHFQDGSYLLRSMHNPHDKLQESLHSSIEAHIGIYKSDVCLEGDSHACLLVDDGMSTINIYSLPNEAPINNIRISNIEFRCVNDESVFREFSHTIKTIGVDALEIKNCHFYDFYGDAICLSHYGDNPSTGERTRNKNVIISNNYIDGRSHNNRNGISVISGQKVTICHNYIEHTSKSNMPGAIDVEANNSAFTVDEIRITNNYIKDSKGSGGAISIVSERDAPARNIVINSNIIEETKCGIFIKIDSRYTTDGFDIQKNQLSNVDIPILVKGAGCSNQWTVRDNSFEFTRKQLKRVNVDNIKCK